MRLVVPFCSKDLERTGLMLGRMLKLGLKDRHVLLACTWVDHFDGQVLFDQFRARYPNSAFFIMPDVPDDEGWPQACNHMFYNCCRWLHATGNTEAFYLLEGDNFPLRVGWDNEIQEEYEKAGLPYMGAVNDSRFSEGGKTVIRGKHMVGTGIYPPNFLEICNGVHTLLDSPWDVAIQDEVVPCCHETQKIHHAWSTGGYHMEAGKLIAEPRNSYNRYGGPVGEEAVVVHGCKDLSLYKLFP